MIIQLATSNADRDLTSQVTVLTDTPDASNPMICQGLILFGDGAKNLDGSGGDFELTITVGGQTIEPDPQTIAFSTAARTAVWTTPFPVPANSEVIMKAKSPNGADTDVDVTAYLYDISGEGALVKNNLDHLAKIATVAADMTSEVADNTILSRMLANGNTSDFVPSTDGLQPIRDELVDHDTAMAAGKTAAQAGDAMTLHGDYDAAKTAAAPGAEMDLVDAPNGTAITAIQNGLATSTEVATNLSAIQDISNVTRISIAIPKYMDRPSAGNKAVKIEVALMDTDGNMEDPDTAQLALTVYNAGGSSMDANLFQDNALTVPLDAAAGTFAGWKKLERTSTGLYFFYYKVAHDASEEELIFKFGWEEGSKAAYAYRASQVSDTKNDLTTLIAAVAALNDLSASDVNDEVDQALSDYDGPTNTEMLSAHTSTDALITALNNVTANQVRDAVFGKTGVTRKGTSTFIQLLILLFEKMVGDKTAAKSGSSKIITHKDPDDNTSDGMVETISKTAAVRT